MENSDAYSIIKELIERRLLVIQRTELVGWLDRLQENGQITEEESKELLQLAHRHKVFDFIKYE